MDTINLCPKFNHGIVRYPRVDGGGPTLTIEPVHTPVCSPQSNGMAESFVNTFKRDYVSLMDRSTAEVVLAQLPDAFTHFNEVHPHSSLNLKSPRMYKGADTPDSEKRR